jgi:hypothetical protein
MQAILLALVQPYLRQILIGGAIALAAGVGWVALKAHYTNQGYQRALDDIAADNKEAIDAAHQARERVRNCRASGGVWDAARGICDRGREQRS